METQRHVADQVVESFKAVLDEHIRGQITDAEYEELALMIGEAIAQELEGAAAMMVNTAEAIRAKLERQQWEL